MSTSAEGRNPGQIPCTSSGTPGEIQAALRADYLPAPPAIARGYSAAARSAIRLISAYTAEIAELEAALAEHFDQHPDTKIVRSLPGLGRSWAPGCWASSVMTGPVLPAPSLARTTPARPLSPKPPGAAASSWPAMPATGGWPTPWSNGRSAPSRTLPGPVATTTSSAPAARPTARPCASSPTAGSAFSTSACAVPKLAHGF